MGMPAQLNQMQTQLNLMQTQMNTQFNQVNTRLVQANTELREVRRTAARNHNRHVAIDEQLAQVPPAQGGNAPAGVPATVEGIYAMTLALINPVLLAYGLPRNGAIRARQRRLARELGTHMVP